MPRAYLPQGLVVSPELTGRLVLMICKVSFLNCARHKLYLSLTLERIKFEYNKILKKNNKPIGLIV